MDDKNKDQQQTEETIKKASEKTWEDDDWADDPSGISPGCG